MPLRLGPCSDSPVAVEACRRTVLVAASAGPPWAARAPGRRPCPRGVGPSENGERSSDCSLKSSRRDLMRRCPFRTRRPRHSVWGGGEPPGDRPRSEDHKGARSCPNLPSAGAVGRSTPATPRAPRRLSGHATTITLAVADHQLPRCAASDARHQRPARPAPRSATRSTSTAPAAPCRDWTPTDRSRAATPAAAHATATAAPSARARRAARPGARRPRELTHCRPPLTATADRAAAGAERPHARGHHEDCKGKAMEAGGDLTGDDGLRREGERQTHRRRHPRLKPRPLPTPQHAPRALRSDDRRQRAVA